MNDLQEKYSALCMQYSFIMPKRKEYIYCTILHKSYILLVY